MPFFPSFFLSFNDLHSKFKISNNLYEIVEQAVVSNLGSNGIMVILDNQITKPGWCCTKYDGNGFFGDRYFDPDEWLQGLTLMATLFKTSTNVVGMSLRNELRGPNQTVSEWYRYMQRGAEAVHAANPNVLVILSGLDYDKDLSFLSENQVQLSFTGKLVFELHWYGFSDGGDWQNGNINEVCASAVRNFTRKGGFLLDDGWPLFLSEFGLDIRGTSIADNRFMSCLASVAAELDLDWAIWALQGSYYVREGRLGFDETYGVLSWDWCKPRNSKFLQRISALQSSFQGPGLSNLAPYDVIFHPQSGLCVRKNSSVGLPTLGSCTESEAWNYTSDCNILLKDAGLCLQADGLGKQVKLADGCGEPNSKWELVSDSQMQVSLQLLRNNGSRVCLDIGDNGTLVTNLCECQSEQRACDPERQWLKIIKSTRNIGGTNSHQRLFSDGSRLEEVPLLLKRDK